MSKSLLHIKARRLRKKGESVKQIAKKLKVAKSTASLWVRDIILTPEQLEVIRKRAIIGSERGRLIGALLQKQARLERIRKEEEAGIKELANLTDREFLIAGLTIYAGEGNKKSREVRISNSDPNIIVFMIDWFKRCFSLTNKDFCCFVGINEVHRHREEIVRNYWFQTTGLPLSCFRKTSFKKSISKKVYENFNEHYGTLDVRI